MGMICDAKGCCSSAVHLITVPDLPRPIQLCEFHFQAVNAKELISEEDIGREELWRRERAKPSYN